MPELTAYSFGAKEAQVLLPDTEFGKFVAEWRERRGLGVRPLASKAGISHATVSKIEDGLVGASKDMVRKLAEALEVPYSEALSAWVKDEIPDVRLVAETDEITYVSDPDTREIIEAYEGLLDQRHRDIVKDLTKKLREAERERSVGGGGGRKVRYEADQDRQDSTNEE